MKRELINLLLLLLIIPYFLIANNGVNTEEMLGSKEIRENTSDLEKVVESVNNAVDEMIIPWYRVQKK